MKYRTLDLHSICLLESVRGGEGEAWQLLSHVWPTKAPAKWEKGCQGAFSLVSVCVCVFVENPDGPMKIIACLARFSSAQDCDAIALDAGKGIKSRERRRRGQCIFCLFALPAVCRTRRTRS